MSDQITADKLTQLRFLFDKFMKPFTYLRDPDVQYRSNIKDMRIDIINSDITLDEFDLYF